MTLEGILLFAILIIVSLVMIKFHIPIMELPIGIFIVIAGMLFADLPYFPFLNLILVVCGIANVLDAIDCLQ